MADEPLEVQLERTRWEGRSKFVKEIGIAVAAIIAAVAMAYGAWTVSQVNGRMDRVAAQNAWTQEQVYQSRLDMRAIEETRQGGFPSGRAVPPPPPKE